MSSLLATALLIIGIIVLLASLDDLIVDILTRLKVRSCRFQILHANNKGDDVRKPSIAIFVANWREADVLGPMVERNLQNITYGSVTFVLGVYPNDPETLEVAMGLAERHPRSVEVVVNRRNGPTSKGQMLNEMFASIFARASDAPDLVVLHDSEDVIAPRSFDVYAREAQRHAMIQIPIFSIDSRDRTLVGATYMEEFAERHTGEMLLREELGAFVPSAGVGTCIRKDLILHFIGERGYVLQPGSVTEDYILGAEAHLAGFSTSFAAYRDGEGPTAPVIATLEYFPKEFWASVKQRTRWTFGIGFEGAKRLGWFGSGWNRFFLYRDRKGAFANFLPLLSILLLFSCLLITPDFRQFDSWQKSLLVAVLAVNSLNILLRVYQKAVALNEIYGSYDVLGLVARWPVALVINALAAGRAWRSFIVESGLASKPISWAKTQHELPATFNMVAARLVAVRSAGARSGSFGAKYSARIGGLVAFAGISLLVAGGLRILEPLTAATVAAPRFDTASSVTKIELGARETANLRLTAQSLAEFSLFGALHRDQQILALTIATPIADQKLIVAALREEIETDAKSDVVPEELAMDWDDRAAVANLRATATALTEFSLQQISHEERMLLDLAQPASTVDTIALVDARVAQINDLAVTKLDQNTLINPARTERDDLMMAAKAGLAATATRDEAIMRLAATTAGTPYLGSPAAATDRVAIDSAAIQANAAKLEKHEDIRELARVSLRGSAATEDAIQKAAAEASGIAREASSQVVAHALERKKLRRAGAGWKRKAVNAYSTGSKKAQRKTAKSKSASVRASVVAAKTAVAPVSGRARATTFLRRRCQGAACRGMGSGSASNAFGTLLNFS